MREHANSCADRQTRGLAPPGSNAGVIVTEITDGRT